MRFINFPPRWNSRSARLLTFLLLELIGGVSAWGSTVVSQTNASWYQQSTPNVSGMGTHDGNYVGFLYQNANQTNDTSSGFYYTSTKIQCTSVAADEGSDWYVVNSGAQFSAANIATNAFTPLVVVGATSYTFYSEVALVPGEDVYLGFRTSLGFPVGERTVYGWLQLRRVSGVLTMISNAVAYDAQGIIVGTTAAIPEPSCMILGVIVAGASLKRRSRRRKDGKGTHPTSISYGSKERKENIRH